MEAEEWGRVWREVVSLSEEFPEDVIVIGGVAVYLHALHGEAALPVEYTHDADIFVGLASLGDLRILYEVVPNRRLSKHQIVVGDVEIDVYVERNSTLRIDFADLALAAVEIDGVRVACLEHLLLLKLDALAARWSSSHGAKDRRDVAKLLVLLEGTVPRFALPQGDLRDVAWMDRALRSSAFQEISEGNSQRASRLRRSASIYVEAFSEAMGRP